MFHSKKLLFIRALSFGHCHDDDRALTAHRLCSVATICSLCQLIVSIVRHLKWPGEAGSIQYKPSSGHQGVAVVKCSTSTIGLCRLGLLVQEY